MKKILSILMTVVMLAVITAVPAYTAEGVDYSDMLSNISTLIAQCNEKGIPTDYEQISYATIERFEDYINADIEKGIDSSYIDYEKSCVDAIYNEAVTNLEGYLDGSKQPMAVSHPDMQKLKIDGSNIYYGNKPVFSIGYGFFGHAQADIPNFQSFGANNIQMEIGPHQTWGQESLGWNIYTGISGLNASATVVSSEAHTGTHSLNMVFSDVSGENRYVAAERTIPCKPNTTYTLGCWAKGTTSDWNAWMTFDWVSSGRVDFLSPSSWTKYERTYTTAADQTSMNALVLVENTANLYLDDFYVYENGSDINLISNAGFESAVYPEIENIKIHLNSAENNNVAVSLLLAPHYLKNIASSNGVPTTTDSGATFINFDINNAKAKEIIEAHIRAVLSNVQGYECIDSICISNEPWFDTRWFDDYQDDFRNYILEKHGNISTIRDLYGMWSWQDIDDVKMPETNFFGNYTINAKAYDWMEFNDKVFAEWHNWMAGIVKEYFPNTPIHSKVMENIIYSGETKERVELARGTDYEMFSEFSGYSGIDGSNYETNDYYEMMFLYDYLDSSAGKPVYNSETHIIKDYYGDTSDLTPLTTGETKKAITKMWQGAIHGRDISTVWAWQRQYADEAEGVRDFFGGILFRPDLVNGIGHMNLDFARLSDDIVELQTYSNKVAILYSKPSRLWTSSHVTSVLDVYKELINNGYDVGVVTEKSIGKLSGYNTLIIPGATHTTQETLTAIENFIAKGGKVLYSGTDVLSKNQHGQSLSNSTVINGGQTYSLAALGTGKVTLKDVSTGAAPEGVEWQYSVTKDRILINAVNMTDSAKTVEVYYNGAKIGNMKELINNNFGISSIALASYEPQLLEYNFNLTGEADVKDLTFDAVRNTINWINVGSNLSTVNIYKYNDDNTITKVYSTLGDEYVYAESGTYLVCAQKSDGTEVDGKVITTVEDAVRINNLYVYGKHVQVTVKNMTEHYLRGNVLVEMFDKDGNVISYGTGKAFIAPNGNQNLDILLSGKGTPASMTVTVFDDMENCLDEETSNITL